LWPDLPGSRIPSSARMKQKGWTNTCASHQPSCLPEAVESCSLLGIAEDLVCFRNELEPLLERHAQQTSSTLKDLLSPRHRRDWQHPACLDATLMLAFCRLSWSLSFYRCSNRISHVPVTICHCSLDLLCICISRDFQQVIEVLSTRKPQQAGRANQQDHCKCL